MDFLTDWLTNWLKELLIGGIMGNLEGLFDTVNTQVGEIAAQVGTTPAAWHAGVFSLIRQLSETVILPIAGMVLTFVATYELIQMLLEKNNMHEVDVANLYKWMFKTACAILILSNTFNIVMAVFDVSQSVIAQAGGLIQGSTDVSADMLAELETSLEAMDLGPLLGLWLQSALIGFTMKANLCCRKASDYRYNGKQIQSGSGLNISGYKDCDHNCKFYDRSQKIFLFSCLYISRLSFFCSHIDCLFCFLFIIFL